MERHFVVDFGHGATRESNHGAVGGVVRDTDDVMLITVGGQMVRTQVKDIREAGRNTQGVKLINLDESDRLQAIAPVISEKAEVEGEDPEALPTPPSPPAPPEASA